jgi:hypothetical protein
MKAQKNPKPTPSSNTTAKTEPSTPVAKQDTVKSTYKPLSKSERLDSIMKAAKKTSGKSSVVPSTPKTDTVVKQTVAPKDSVKKVAVAKVDSTKNKNSAKPQPKPVVKTDTLVSKPVQAAKDTVKKIIPAKVDSSKSKGVAKPVVKPATKTDTIKPKTAIVKTDTAKQKAAAKPTVVLPKQDTVKVSQPKVSTNIVVVDSSDKEPIYGLSDAAPHQIVIYFKDGDKFSSAMVAKLETFEQAKYTGVALTNRSVILDSKNKLILVKSFGNKTDALAAAKTLQTGVAEAIGIPGEEVYVFAISTLNYTTLISTKRLGNYLNFYKENYK